jgi:cell fate (sporulation/competence/biofilm development) regulator YlbF (YheA/YmcA/DUF963 family)
MTEKKMPFEEILQAARELGEAVRANPLMQEYLNAKEAAEKDEALQQLQRELETFHNELLLRQQVGEAIPSNEVSQYYRLRDQMLNHPLYARQQAALRAVRAIFEQAGDALSSILTIDFTEFVK